MSAKQAGSSDGEFPGGADFMATLASGLRDGMDLLSGFAATMNPAMAGMKPSAANAEQLAAIAPVMAEAAAIAFRSWTRYGQGLAEIAGRRNTGLLQAMTAEAGAGDRGALVEELRACMREIGETAMREARHLERDLADLSESMAQSAAPDAAAGPYRRAWRAKR